MTQQEFIAYVKLYPSQVNVKYSENLTGPSVIDGISVPVLDLVGTNLTDYLQQVQQLTIPLTTGGIVTVNIVSKSQSFVTTPAGLQIRYFIFEVQQLTITRPTSTIVNQGLVALSPYVRSLTFGSSPYNVIQGSIEKPRTSDYVMKADRYRITGISGSSTYTGPSNIDLLLAGSASKAEIQDSLYSSTGWSNSRYEGSKTSVDTYKVEAATSGKIFKATVYPISTPSSYIKSQHSSSAVIYNDYFHSANIDLPTYLGTQGVYGSNRGGIAATPWELSGVVTSATETVFTFKWVEVTGTGTGGAVLGWTPIRLLAPGTLLRLTFFQPEIVKVISSVAASVGTLTPTGNPTARVTVQRRYYGTPTLPIGGSGQAVWEVPQQVVYELEGNKLKAVANRKVLVKDSGEILDVDSRGQVVGPVLT